MESEVISVAITVGLPAALGLAGVGLTVGGVQRLGVRPCWTRQVCLLKQADPSACQRCAVYQTAAGRWRRGGGPRRRAAGPVAEAEPVLQPAPARAP